MTKPNLELIITINTLINLDPKYKSDTSIFNHPNFFTKLINLHDHLDYSLAKRLALIKSGVLETDLRLACCWNDQDEYFSVLIVSTINGCMVLDKANPKPMFKQGLNYRWHKIQEGNTWYYL